MKNKCLLFFISLCSFTLYSKNSGNEYNKEIDLSITRFASIAEGNFIKDTQLVLESSLIDAYVNPFVFTSLSLFQETQREINYLFTSDYFYQNCNIIIPKVSQVPSGVYNKRKLCFEYDASGNYMDTIDCDSIILASRSNNLDIEFENLDESIELSLDEIKSLIKVYPNPTEGIINVFFDEAIFGLISKVEVFSPSGALIKSNSISPSDSMTSFDIIGYPNGVYLLKFTLNSEEYFSINIIKK